MKKQFLFSVLLMLFSIALFAGEGDFNGTVKIPDEAQKFKTITNFVESGNMLMTPSTCWTIKVEYYSYQGTCTMDIALAGKTFVYSGGTVTKYLYNQPGNSHFSTTLTDCDTGICNDTYCWVYFSYWTGYLWGGIGGGNISCGWDLPYVFVSPGQTPQCP